MEEIKDTLKQVALNKLKKSIAGGDASEELKYFKQAMEAVDKFTVIQKVENENNLKTEELNTKKTEISMNVEIKKQELEASNKIKHEELNLKKEELEASNKNRKEEINIKKHEVRIKETEAKNNKRSSRLDKIITILQYAVVPIGLAIYEMQGERQMTRDICEWETEGTITGMAGRSFIPSLWRK